MQIEFKSRPAAGQSFRGTPAFSEADWRAWQTEDGMGVGGGRSSWYGSTLCCVCIWYAIERKWRPEDPTRNCNKINRTKGTIATRTEEKSKST